VAVANTGDNVPLLNFNAERLALAGLVAVMVYVFVVTPSCAVDTILITLVPSFNVIGADAVPGVVVTPFTFRVAVGSCSVAVTVMLLVVAATVVV
jgi:hypothetical protein